MSDRPELPNLDGVRLAGPVTCDSCGELVHEEGRFRDAACPAPPMPPAARAAIDAARRQT